MFNTPHSTVISRLFHILFLSCCIALNASAQEAKLSFFENAPHFHPQRTIGVSSAIGLGFSGVVGGLYGLYYKDLPKTSFYFHNDNPSWNQIDKFGHGFGAYLESKYMIDAFKWAGWKRKRAIWIGGTLGMMFQTTFEFFDAVNDGWGFSYGDLTANTLGAALVVSQQLLWDEQRIHLKFSSHPVNYQIYDPAVQARAESLYGAFFFEQMIQDYNGQTFWLSFNPVYLVNPNTRFPKWLNISIGYGIEGVFGARTNQWYAGGFQDYNDIARVRQFYLSLDIDLTKIPTRSKALKFIFKTLNIIKIPAPTIQFSSNGKVEFYPFYF